MPSQLALFFELGLSFCNNLIPESIVTLLRGHVIDSAVQVFSVVPPKVFVEVPEGVLQVKESAGIIRGGLHRAKG